jgi:hypothetical protein
VRIRRASRNLFLSVFDSAACLPPLTN